MAVRRIFLIIIFHNQTYLQILLLSAFQNKCFYNNPAYFLKLIINTCEREIISIDSIKRYTFFNITLNICACIQWATTIVLIIIGRGQSVLHHQIFKEKTPKLRNQTIKYYSKFVIFMIKANCNNYFSN